MIFYPKLFIPSPGNGYCMAFMITSLWVIKNTTQNTL